MAKKTYVRLIWLVFWTVALAICSLYLKAIDEKGTAFLLFLCDVYFFGSLIKFLRDIHLYQELCSELEYIGKDPAHQAVKLYRLKGVALWVQHAPKEEKERFVAAFSQMSENDFGYGELKYIVEQLKKW